MSTCSSILWFLVGSGQDTPATPAAAALAPVYTLEHDLSGGIANQALFELRCSLAIPSSIAFAAADASAAAALVSPTTGRPKPIQLSKEPLTGAQLAQLKVRACRLLTRWGFFFCGGVGGGDVAL